MKPDFVIMAGGLGERLKPYTNSTPKCLLKIGNRRIIDDILARISYYNKIYIIGNYLFDQVKYYINSKYDHIEVFKEPYAMGTIGGIKNIESVLNNNFIVLNCDTLTNINYKELYNNHIRNKNYMTINVAAYSIKLEYGIIKEKNRNLVSEIQEKPKIEFKMNTGIYCLNKKSLAFIKDHVDATDLVQKLLEEKKQVGYYMQKDFQHVDLGNKSNYEQLVRS